MLGSIHIVIVVGLLY